ncbi:MAG TPA: NAD(P)H-hydrate epimerase, partial [Anaerolineales bacterium]|nr:NAD(P)H-hydrate epimerase [Anaerolineales bacterium]
MKLVTVPQMIALEKQADASGLSYVQMMQNAGIGLAKIVHEIGVQHHWKKVVGLVGSGNNGGDTLVALTWLAQNGWDASAYLVKTRDDDLTINFLTVGGKIIKQDESFFHLSSSITESDVTLDGVLGTGIKLPLKKEASEVLNFVKYLKPKFVVAVDCPSGV